MGIITPPPPVPFALYDGDYAVDTASSIAANTVNMTGIVVYTTVTVTNMRCYFGTGGNGHYDLGIYDATGANNAPNNLLGHCAAANTTLVTVATTLVSPALIANVTLTPGRYWLALWIDNATDTVGRVGAVNSGLAVNLVGNNNGPLPALASSITSLVNTNRRYGILGLLSGNWS